MPQHTRCAFASAFQRWKKTWFHGSLALSSNPTDRAHGSDYQALCAFGQMILPLVVRELGDPDNFMALQLYDALQTDERLRVRVDVSDPAILEGEQGRARRTVEAWCAAG